MCEECAQLDGANVDPNFGLVCPLAQGDPWWHPLNSSHPPAIIEPWANEKNLLVGKYIARGLRQLDFFGIILDRKHVIQINVINENRFSFDTDWGNERYVLRFCFDFNSSHRKCVMEPFRLEYFPEIAK